MVIPYKQLSVKGRTVGLKCLLLNSCIRRIWTMSKRKEAACIHGLGRSFLLSHIRSMPIYPWSMPSYDIAIWNTIHRIPLAITLTFFALLTVQQSSRRRPPRFVLQPINNKPTITNSLSLIALASVPLLGLYTRCLPLALCLSSIVAPNCCRSLGYHARSAEQHSYVEHCSRHSLIQVCVMTWAQFSAPLDTEHEQELLMRTMLIMYQTPFLVFRSDAPLSVLIAFTRLRSTSQNHSASSSAPQRRSR